MSELSMSAFNGKGGPCPVCEHPRCLRPSCVKAMRWRDALIEIAGEDYRGNRSAMSTTAYYALHPEEKP